jgi:hypothetical protein
VPPTCRCREIQSTLQNPTRRSLPGLCRWIRRRTVPEADICCQGAAPWAIRMRYAA